MPIADFNKDNPFVIIMKDKNSLIHNLSNETLKSILISLNICLIYTFIVTILCRDIRTIFIWSYIVIRFFIIFSQLVNTLKSKQKEFVNKVIYGNEYQLIFANNEKILEVISKQDEVIGMLRLTQFSAKMELVYVLIASAILMILCLI